jgi:hypothetical protein
MKSTTYFITIVLLLMTININAQNHSNLLYGEIGGNGLFYSINYERVLSKNFRAKVGLSYLHIIEKGTNYNHDIITFPITASYLYPIGKKGHIIEAGLGVMFLISRGNIVEYRATTDLFPNITSILAYRYEKPTSRFSFKVGLTPFFGMKSLTEKSGTAFSPLGNQFQLWGGIGIGYKF